MIKAYQAWCVNSNTGLPNPTPVYADVASVMSLIKNGATVALALISDFIMVRRCYAAYVCAKVTDTLLGLSYIRSLAYELPRHTRPWDALSD